MCSVEELRSARPAANAYTPGAHVACTGAFLVTLGSAIVSADIELLESEVYRMSWGGTKVHIHRRR